MTKLQNYRKPNKKIIVLKTEDFMSSFFLFLKEVKEMVLTVKQLYHILNKMHDEEKNKSNDQILEDLLRCGNDGPYRLFEESYVGGEMFQSNGRIYVICDWHERPITNDFLKFYKLSKSGIKFVKKYL